MVDSPLMVGNLAMMMDSPYLKEDSLFPLATVGSLWVDIVALLVRKETMSSAGASSCLCGG